MDYLGFFDLKMEPFRNDPDERFYFESAGARRAYLRILRGVHQHKGLGVLIGPPGCGKTTLGDHLVRGLDPESWAPRFLSIGHSDCSLGWLLPHVAQAFEVGDPAADAPGLLDQIHERFVGLQGLGRHPVLVVDEAQLLRTPEVMEEFRALLNLAHDGRKTMSIVLLGLPELAEALALDAPLEQRVETRVEIDPLDAAEIAKYVAHRLAVAGGTGLFAEGSVELLAAFSGGVPRLVNTLADNALFESFLAEERPVEPSVIAEAAHQLGLERIEPGARAKGPSVRPEWMDSLVPPPESDFKSDLEIEAAPIAEEQPDLEAPAGSAPALEPDDFSMGSIVRELEEDEDEDDGDDDGFEIIPEPETQEDDEDGFAIVTERVARREEEADALELDLEEDGELELELEPAAALEDDEAGMETRVALDSDSAALEIEPASNGAAAAAVSDGEFDPTSLLDEDSDDEGEAPDTLDGFDPSCMIDDDDAPAARAAPRAAEPEPEEEEEEDLDALFDEIQVPD